MGKDEYRFRHDPIEDNPKIKLIVEAARKEAEKQLQAEGREFMLGYCHMLWGRQQDILKEKHGIHWKSPAEMNPDAFFD